MTLDENRQFIEEPISVGVIQSAEFHFHYKELLIPIQVCEKI